MSGKIFVNYRRADAADAAGRLYDRLEPEFGEGKIFMDVDRLGAGVDFVKELQAQVVQCDVFLAVIGPSWLTITDEDSGVRRLDNPNDWVRIEITDALERDVRVIPVLINNAPIPREDQLPDGMKHLARRNALRLTHERYHSDVQGLIVQINDALQEAEMAREEEARTAELAHKRAARKAEEEAKAEAHRQREKRDSEQLAELGPEKFEAMREQNNWTFIQDKQDVTLLRDHRARFPGGETLPYATEKLEALIWADLSGDLSAELSDDLSGELGTKSGGGTGKARLESFLQEFPEGPNAAQARARLDASTKAEIEAVERTRKREQENTAWQAVKDTKDPATLKAFLADWPEGAHVPEAKRLLRAHKGGLPSRRNLLIVVGSLAVGVGGVVGAVTYGPSIWFTLIDTSLRTFKGHKEYVRSVAFSPDGRRALSGSWDKTLKLWDLASGKLMRTFTGHSLVVDSVALSPDGRRALSGGYDGTLKLWDVGGGKLLRTFTGHSHTVNSVAFSADGRRALSGSWDFTLKLWDVASGKVLRTFKGHLGFVYSVAFSPDGRRALSGSDDKTLKLWDLASGKTLRTFTGHSGPVSSVAFSPDGRRALSGSYDDTLKLWDLASGKLLRSLTGHSGDVNSVSFSPDGATALSGGDDKTLKLWDLASGKLLRTFSGHSGNITSVACSPDGNTALSGSYDGTLKLWDLR